VPKPTVTGTLTPNLIPTPTPKLVYAPVVDVGEVEGVSIPFSLELGEDMLNNGEYKSVNLNPNYKWHGDKLNRYYNKLGNDNPADTFVRFAMQALWLKHLRDYPSDKGMTLAEFMANPKIKVSKDITEVTDATMPTSLQTVDFVIKGIKVIVVTKIHGTDDLNDGSYQKNNGFVKAMDVQTDENGNLIIYFVPGTAEEDEASTIADSILGLDFKQSRNKQFMEDVFNCIWLLRNTTKADLINGHYDWSKTAERMRNEGNDPKIAQANFDFLKANPQAYANPFAEAGILYPTGGSIPAVTLVLQPHAGMEYDATPLFIVN
jgi:hypothetical protein